MEKKRVIYVAANEDVLNKFCFMLEGEVDYSPAPNQGELALSVDVKDLNETRKLVSIVNKSGIGYKIQEVTSGIPQDDISVFQSRVEDQQREVGTQ